MNIIEQSGTFLAENEFICVVQSLAQPTILAYTRLILLNSSTHL
jgi:hypothetical protein